MMTTEFWKPEPRQPWQDWRTYSLIIPLFISSVAFALFSVFTYALDDIAVIASLTQARIVIVAAFCAAIGAEVGTPFTMIEVFRKARLEEVNRRDWAALIASLLATLLVVTIGMAARITTTLEVAPVWAIALTTWGPALVGAVVVLDGYGGMTECGDLFGSFEQRMARWLEERQEWRQDMAELDRQVAEIPDPMEGRFDEVARMLSAMDEQIERLAKNVQRLTDRTVAVEATNQALRASIDRLAWPVAHKTDFDAYVSSLNGERGMMTKETLEAGLAERQMVMPSPSTVGRWLDSLENGG